MYQRKTSDVDIRRIRPLNYSGADIVLWKSYFGRFTPELNSSLESTEGMYSRSYAYEKLKSDNKSKYQLLYQNYLKILELRDNSS